MQFYLYVEIIIDGIIKTEMSENSSDNSNASIWQNKIKNGTADHLSSAFVKMSLLDELLILLDRIEFLILRSKEAFDSVTVLQC